MRSLVRSETYARTRVGIGVLALILGIAIIVRTIATVGVNAAEIPALALGGAMIALGLVRVRDYLKAKGNR